MRTNEEALLAGHHRRALHRRTRLRDPALGRPSHVFVTGSEWPECPGEVKHQERSFMVLTVSTESGFAR